MAFILYMTGLRKIFGSLLPLYYHHYLPTHHTVSFLLLPSGMAFLNTYVYPMRQASDMPLFFSSLLSLSCYFSHLLNYSIFISSLWLVGLLTSLVCCFAGQDMNYFKSMRQEGRRRRDRQTCTCRGWRLVWFAIILLFCFCAAVPLPSATNHAAHPNFHPSFLPKTNLEMDEHWLVGGDCCCLV